MSTLRTSDVLDQAREFHARLSSYYAGLSDGTPSERLRLLFDYLSRHEQQMSESLHRYRHDAAPRILDVWLQNVPDERALKSCAILDLDTSADAEDIITAALRYDDCVIDLYQHMQDLAPHEELRDVFANLMEMERHEQQRATRNAQMICDM